MSTLVGLFLGAFLAATILPFSSEIMLVAALQAGEAPVWLLVSVAAAGNILGAVVNWWLGGALLYWQDRRWFPFSPKAIERASEQFRRYGQWSLLFAFVPFIGDPLTLVAGLLRMKFWPFLVLVSIGKTARYVFIGWAF